MPQTWKKYIKFLQITHLLSEGQTYKEDSTTRMSFFPIFFPKQRPTKKFSTTAQSNQSTQDSSDTRISR